MDNIQPEALLKLHDIRMPNPISAWQIAPGWYLLVAITIFIMLSLGFVVFKNYSFWLTKRQALRLLAKYKTDYSHNEDSQKTCALINELLKKVAIAFYSRGLVAGLQGVQWLNFLDQTYLTRSKYLAIFTKILPNKKNLAVFDALQKELLEYPYQKLQKINLDLLFTTSEAWIKKQTRLNNKTKERLCLN